MSWWPRPMLPFWCYGETGIRLQSFSSRPSNPLPRIVDNGRARAARDGRECPLICCVMRSSADTTAVDTSDTIHPVSFPCFRYDTHPIIVHSLIQDFIQLQDIFWLNIEIHKI